MKTVEIHNELLEFLLEKEVFFKPRKINRGKRLEQGYWFLGTEKYLNIGFWGGKDWKRKINNIGFQINFTKEKNIYLCLSARSDPARSVHLTKIAKIVGAKRIKDKDGLWIKIYQSNAGSVQEYIKHLGEFIDTDRNLINKYIKENTTPFTQITSKEFFDSIGILNRHRQSKISLNPDFEIAEVGKVIKRKGVTDLSLKKQLRKILASEIEVTNRHVELQMQLKDQIVNSEGGTVLFEENYVDVKHIKENEVHIYEVKPYSSVIRCVREGLGQLLFYYSQNENENITKLFIAGPSEPNDNETEFLEFLKEKIDIDFDYLGIGK